MHHSGDYIKIYDINDNGMSTVITSLTGADTGPISYLEIHWSRWQKKIVSSTSNKMLVEFRSDDDIKWNGFSAFIHYSPLPSNECQKGLDMTKKIIQSPNYPNSYDSNLSCNWLISVPYGSYITLKFLQFDVSSLVISIVE